MIPTKPLPVFGEPCRNCGHQLDDDTGEVIVQGRAISDIPARRQCDTCSLVHENCVEINTGEGPDRANSATLCGHCVETIRRELATVVRERDEALATIADFHKSRIRKQTEREAAMDAEISRLARTVDRKDEQMAELQERIVELETRLAAVTIPAEQYAAVLGAIDNPSPPSEKLKALFREASSAQPATATKKLHRLASDECAGCAKVARHPGEEYVCVMHYQPPAAPPSPAARECSSDCIISPGHTTDCLTADDISPAPRPRVISSNRDPKDKP